MDSSIFCPNCTASFLKINNTSLHEFTCQHCGHIWPKSINDVKNELILLRNTYNALDKAHQIASDQIQHLNEFKELATVTNIGYQQTIAEFTNFLVKVINLNRFAKEHIDDEFFFEAKRLINHEKI